MSSDYPANLQRLVVLQTGTKRKATLKDGIRSLELSKLRMTTERRSLQKCPIKNIWKKWNIFDAVVCFFCFTGTSHRKKIMVAPVMFLSGLKVRFVAVECFMWRLLHEKPSTCREMWADFMRDKLWVWQTSSKALKICSSKNPLSTIRNNKLITQGKQLETSATFELKQWYTGLVSRISLPLEHSAAIHFVLWCTLALRSGLHVFKENLKVYIKYIFTYITESKRSWKSEE